MARVRDLIPAQRDTRSPLTEVDVYYQSMVGSDGTLFLYLYNFAAHGPKQGDTPTQSLHFDRQAAKRLKKVLEDTFDLS